MYGCGVTDHIIHRVWSRPDLRLAPLVSDYRCYRDPGSPAHSHVPGDDLTLIFNLEGTLDVEDPDGGARELRSGEVYLGGLQTGRAVTAARERQCGIIVGVTPIGAYRMLGGAPQEELVDSSILLEGCRELMSRLWDASDDGARFALVDRFLRERMSRETESTGMRWAWTRLLQSHGTVSIGELARDLGWSRKRLAARFREQVGLTPKRAARLLRFDHAMKLADAEPLGWAEVAAACGYTDQAHLSREVHEFAGVSPHALRFARETFLQDSWIERRQDS